jgi:hypothetical protein
MHERKLAMQATQAAQITKQVNTLLAYRQGKGSQRKEGYINKLYQKQKHCQNQDNNQDKSEDQDNQTECWYCLKKGYIEKQY